MIIETQAWYEKQLTCDFSFLSVEKCVNENDRDEQQTLGGEKKK